MDLPADNSPVQGFLRRPPVRCGQVGDLRHPDPALRGGVPGCSQGFSFGLSGSIVRSVLPAPGSGPWEAQAVCCISPRTTSHHLVDVHHLPLSSSVVLLKAHQGLTAAHWSMGHGLAADRPRQCQPLGRYEMSRDSLERRQTIANTDFAPRGLCDILAPGFTARRGLLQSPDARQSDADATRRRGE